jgi:hypothetical protein
MHDRYATIIRNSHALSGDNIGSTAPIIVGVTAQLELMDVMTLQIVNACHITSP